MDIDLRVDISTEDLAYRLVDVLDEDELFCFIVTLDESVADYDFTVKLRNHFIKQVEKEDSDDD